MGGASGGVAGWQARLETGPDLARSPGIRRERWKPLTDVFAMAVAGFAILDNHLHVLTRLDPHLVDGWSDEEVARRWGRLYPPRKRRRLVPLTPEWIQKRAGDPQWVAKTRERLKSLSWFMKLLKEPLARLANREDECDGAFFASQFKSIGILDETALLEVCAYIDLNPLAEGITFLPEHSPHASVMDRVTHAWPQLTSEDFEAALRGLTVEHLSSGNVEQSLWLCPLKDRSERDGTREGMLPGLSLPKYLLLLDYTSRVARGGKASLSAEVAPIFERRGTTAQKWTQRVTQLTQIFQGHRITGQFLATTSEVLEQLAQRLGKRHLVNLTDSGPAVSVATAAATG